MFFSTIYSYFDPLIAINKRSFNTKNVKEKQFPVWEKPVFASECIKQPFLNHYELNFAEF